MRFFRIALLSLTSCSTVISPDALRTSASQDMGTQAVARWNQSVELVNDFLAEEPPDALPWFRLGWSDRLGMFLVRENGVQPFRVACTPWGRLVVLAGFTAQERSWGFVVGLTSGAKEPQIDNSFFQGNFGMRGPHSLGGLILHEAVHTMQPSGTVSFFRGLRYYWYSIWHGGGEEHPDETLAYEIERDFRDWASRRAVIQG